VVGSLMRSIRVPSPMGEAAGEPVVAH
jgi:hypothetical protein